jgi:hypothetical protein
MSKHTRVVRGVALLSVVAIGALVAVGWSSIRHRRQTVAEQAMASEREHEVSRGRRLERGPAPRIDPTARERAAQVVRETLKIAPTRLSTTAALPPFDKQAYDADPRAYLAEVEPARCFQTAPPSAEGRPLEVQVSARSAMPTGGETPLWVKGVPGAPVTFTSFDGGAFKENGLPSVTVQADGRGLAVAHFTAGKGIGGDVSIVAGSPLSVGVQRFVIRVGGALAAVAEQR